MGPSPKQYILKQLLMENESESDNGSAASEQGSILKKMFNVLRIGRSPDTTEALEHEIQELLEEGEEQGLITSLEERMINSIFDFRDTVAAEIMTPAAEIVSFEVTTPIPEIIEAVIDEGFTRLPVYRENSDKVVGVLHVKDLLKICNRAHDSLINLEDYLNPAFFVHENKPIGELLKSFQRDKTHMAMVVDEFGAVRGLVTLEDVLEEIVGEIDDEYDVEEDDFETLSTQATLVKARVDIEDVEERLKITLPEGPYESIGGLIIHSLGRLAEEGDIVRIGDVELLVHSAGRRRIKKVRITKGVTEGGI